MRFFSTLADGQLVQVTTEAGSEVVELETTVEGRTGTILIPHGLGLHYMMLLA